MKTNLILLLFLFSFTTSLICQPLILNNPNTSLIFGTIDNVKDENSDVHQIITLKDVKSIYNFVDTNLLQINITANAITYCLSCFPNYFSDNMIGECVFLFIEKKNNEYYLIPNPNSNTIFNSNLLFPNSIKLLENHNSDSLFYSIKDYYNQFDTSNFFALSEYLKNKIIDTTEYEFIRLNSVFEFNFLVTNRANFNDELYYFYYYNCLYWIFNNIELPYIIARTIFIQIHNYLYTQEFLNSTDKYNLIKMYNIDNQIFIREKIIKELKELKTIKSNLFVKNFNSDSLLFLIGKVVSVKNNFIYLENIRGINKDFVKEKLKIKIILDTDKVENIQIDKLLNKEILVNVYCDDNIYYTYTKKNLFYPTLTPNFGQNTQSLTSFTQ